MSSASSNFARLVFDFRFVTILCLFCQLTFESLLRSEISEFSVPLNL